MKKSIGLIILLVTLSEPTAAFAYVGPGAGLSLLGALWALLAAVATAIFFVVAWPIRKMVRSRRSRKLVAQEATGDTVKRVAASTGQEK
ncbi:hypothetical protein [Mesorhizobium sp. RMAD-H1]|uniref:hypothetical protein n=1 Tax=Mesorhizobium sp. RMAD-H1 TaxID=2587065 RepID=UPI0016176FA8|nr:hypothetical protein [Mesorhizobium sp. RMAD-H1]MBB2969932.1 membrane protein implicated in regulation of membrane protease activity [Mesorhizobium sp. RMAD-H1]